MKKVMALVLVLFIGFTGCKKEIVGGKANVVALKGPTGMGMVKLMEDNELGKTTNDYTFNLSGAPDEVVGMITTGQGTTPEYVLNYVLEQNGLIVGKDVEVEYRAEHSEVATLMAAGEIEIALLPQPFVTSVLMQNKNVKIALDMTKEWKNVSGENPSALVMGSIIVRIEFLDKNKEVVDSFLREYCRGRIN
ncbi:MAG: hypothetical protein ACREVX_15155 [Clostridium sp.]|uniref:hypothetical protein n=1 Tax=Clostridium sp. TaxID=1506 RepID=UPI003D6CCABF